MLQQTRAGGAAGRRLHLKFADREETVWAVNGVSFKVMPGEVLCIIA